MNGDDLDTALRARLHGAVDPLAPAAGAGRRIELALRDAMAAAPSRAGWPGAGRALSWAAAGLVAAVFAAALGASVALNHRGSGTAAPKVVPTPTATATPGPTPTPLPSPTPTEPPPPSPVPPQAILPPATVRPAPGIPECSTPITRTADGNAYPLFCNDSPGINVEAWDFYASLHPGVMALGYAATPAQIKAAICVDLANGHVTNPEEANAAEISARYYGWADDHYDTYANDAMTCR